MKKLFLFIVSFIYFCSSDILASEYKEQNKNYLKLINQYYQIENEFDQKERDALWLADIYFYKQKEAEQKEKDLYCNMQNVTKDKAAYERALKAHYKQNPDEDPQEIIKQSKEQEKFAREIAVEFALKRDEAIKKQYEIQQEQSRELLDQLRREQHYCGATVQRVDSSTQLDISEVENMVEQTPSPESVLNEEGAIEGSSEDNEAEPEEQILQEIVPEDSVKAEEFFTEPEEESSSDDVLDFAEQEIKRDTISKHQKLKQAAQRFKDLRRKKKPFVKKVKNIIGNSESGNSFDIVEHENVIEQEESPVQVEKEVSKEVLKKIDLSLHKAISKNQTIEEIKKLITFAAATTADDDDNLPLHLAAMYKNLDACKCIVNVLAENIHDSIEFKKAIDTLNKANRTALYYAIDKKQLAIVDYLLSKGANRDLLPEKIKNKLIVLAQNHSKEVAVQAENNPDLAKINEELKKAEEEAFGFDDMSFDTEIDDNDDKNYGASLKKVNPYLGIGKAKLSNMLFMHVKHYIKLKLPELRNDIINMILAGADLTKKDINGATYLHHFSAIGDHEVVKLLIEHGTTIDAQDMIGNTPLHLAVQYRNKKVVEYLIDLGVNTQIKNNELLTPLLESTLMGKPEIFELLISDAINILKISWIQLLKDCDGADRKTEKKYKKLSEYRQFILIYLAKEKGITADESSYFDIEFYDDGSHTVFLKKKLQTGGQADSNSSSSSSSYDPVQENKKFIKAITDGNFAKVKNMFEANNNIIHFKDTQGRLPIHYAAMAIGSENKYLVILEFLLTQSTDMFFKPDHGDQTAFDLLKTGNNFVMKDHLIGIITKRAKFRHMQHICDELNKHVISDVQKSMEIISKDKEVNKLVLDLIVQQKSNEKNNSEEEKLFKLIKLYANTKGNMYLTRIKEMIESGVNLLAKNEEGLTPILMAINLGANDLLSILCKYYEQKFNIQSTGVIFREIDEFLLNNKNNDYKNIEKFKRDKIKEILENMKLNEPELKDVDINDLILDYMDDVPKVKIK